MESRFGNSYKDLKVKMSKNWVALSFFHFFFPVNVSEQLVACALPSPSLWLCGQPVLSRGTWALGNGQRLGLCRFRVLISQAVKASEALPPLPAVSGGL